MIGEILAGVLLGPSVLDLIHVTPELKAIADIGVLLLVFLAGMEIDLHDVLAAVRGRGIWVGLLGFAVPLGMGLAVGHLFAVERSIFLGLCIAITALPVSVRILMDVGHLHSRLGQRILSAAVLNDVIALLILGIILGTQGTEASWNELVRRIVLVLVKAMFFMACVLVASHLIRYSTGRLPVSRQWLNRLLGRLKGQESLFAVTLLIVLVFAGISEAIGLHFVVGAFFGSMLLNRGILGQHNFHAVERTASSVTMGFLGPVFFAEIGLEFHVRSLEDWGLVAAVLAVAFGGKLLGGFVGGRLAGHSVGESWTLGIGLNGRGIMELVIASIALEKGLIDAQLFAILILMGTLTTVVTPIALNRAFQRLGDPEHHTTDPQDAPVPHQAEPESLVINDPPVTHPDFKTVPQQTRLTFPATDLTANDHDPEGSPLTVIGVTAHAETHGQVGLTDDMVTYLPDASFTGRASFDYLVRDEQGGIAKGIVYVDVKAAA
jgi:Kef-type K+ transport system membrane component KefB